MHDVAGIGTHGARGEPRRIETDIGLGNRETGLLVSLHQRRQKAPLLRLAAEHHHRIEAEDVHVHRRGAGKGRARLGDCLHHHGGFGDAEPRTAISLGNSNAEPAGIGKGAMKVVRKVAVTVSCQPVVIAELGAKLQNCRADFLLGRGQVHRRHRSPSRVPTTPVLLKSPISSLAKPQSPSTASVSAPRGRGGNPKSAWVRLKRGAGAGCSTSSRRTKVWRILLCGWCSTSASDSTGATQASLPANTASHSSRVRVAMMRAKCWASTGHPSRSYCLGRVAGSRPSLPTNSA